VQFREISLVTFDFVPRVLSNVLIRFVNSSLRRRISNCLAEYNYIHIAGIEQFHTNLFTTKSRECKSDFLKDMLQDFTRLKTTRAEAILPILPNIPLAAR